MDSFNETATPKQGIALLESWRCVAAFALGLALFVAGPASAQTKSDPDYIAGFAAWQEARYPVASDHLSRYRISASYGKSYDVDYLLGTSWCRMQGMARKGLGLLDWALQHDLPEPAAVLFRTERDLCRTLSDSQVATARPVLLARTNLSAGASATARASGKMYYSVGSNAGAFAAYPLELVKPLPEEEYARRIFPLSATDDAIQATKGRIGEGFRVVAADRFILTSRVHSEQDLRTIAASLAGFVAFLRDEYQIRFPEAYVTIYLIQEPQALVDFAMSVHGLRASTRNLGYTFQNDLSIVGLVRATEVGSLLHELFHLGVRADFGDIPSWLDESIASLYETSTKTQGAYAGVANWRGGVIKSMGGGRGFRVDQLVAYLSSDSSSPERSAPVEYRSDKAAYEAALGRYFAFYLQERRTLRATYMAFRDRPEWTIEMPAQEASVKLIEGTTGLPAGQLEKDFTTWLQAAIGSPTSGTGAGSSPLGGPANANQSIGPPAGTPSTEPCRGEQQQQQQQQQQPC